MPTDVITPVERNIGHLATQAFTDAEIAQSLGLSEDKVAESIVLLIRKLGLIDRVGLMLFFFFNGARPDGGDRSGTS